MKIKEMAERLHTTARAIRFYEEKGLIRPLKKTENGYREYSEQDAWRLQTIISLRELGMGLKEISGWLGAFESGDIEKQRHYLELQRMAMYTRWIQGKRAITAVDEALNRLDEGKGLQREELFRLADRLREVQQAQSSWRDRWDFDRMANTFDSETLPSAIGTFVSAREYEDVLKTVGHWVSPQPGETGLDLGTGTGNLAAKLKTAGAAIRALEQSAEMLKIFRRNHPGIPAKLGNMLAVPYVDREFNFIASSFAFHHLTDEQQLLALEEMDRVLKPNGRICLAGLMSENKLQREMTYKSLHDSGQTGMLGELDSKHPSDRDAVLRWFKNREYITIHQQLNDWVHLVYAVRKN